jgi:CheY-like chemotaxis protein
MLCVDRGGQYEAIVLHLYLRGMDGAELCRWAESHSSLRGIPKVAFTWAGLRMPVDVSSGLPKWLPVDRYIEGIQRAEDLVEAVDSLLASRRQAGGRLA